MNEDDAVVDWTIRAYDDWRARLVMCEQFDDVTYPMSALELAQQCWVGAP